MAEKAKARILVIDDEEPIRASLSEVLQDEGYLPLLAESAEEGFHLLKREEVDLVLLDIWLPGMDGVTALKRMKEEDPLLPVIVISGHGTIETAVKTVKLGAYDFVEKPISLDELLIRITNALEQSRLRKENLRLRERMEEERTFIAQSPAMQELLMQVEIVAPTDGWVLLMGESGTGKELVARQVHERSLRKNGPFVEVNCAALPEERVEVELFGSEETTYEGGKRVVKGRFEQSSGGSLFLDEVGDMSLTTQAKVLRTLQELAICRVGGSEVIPLDLRVIASTNKDLERAIKEGRFREDLFFRLNVVPITVPPLRERREDVIPLCEHFLSFFCTRYGRSLKHLSPRAEGMLKGYSWPGNVRELKNVMERLVIMVQEDEIIPSHLPLAIQQEVGEGPGVLHDQPLKDAKDAFERRYIIEQLERHNWNISHTAEALGIERSNLYKKMKQLNIERRAGQ